MKKSLIVMLIMIFITSMLITFNAYAETFQGVEIPDYSSIVNGHNDYIIYFNAREMKLKLVNVDDLIKAWCLYSFYDDDYTHLFIHRQKEELLKYYYVYEGEWITGSRCDLGYDGSNYSYNEDRIIRSNVISNLQDYIYKSTFDIYSAENENNILFSSNVGYKYSVDVGNSITFKDQAVINLKADDDIFDRCYVYCEHYSLTGLQKRFIDINSTDGAILSILNGESIRLTNMYDINRGGSVLEIFSNVPKYGEQVSTPETIFREGENYNCIRIENNTNQNFYAELVCKGIGVFKKDDLAYSFELQYDNNLAEYFYTGKFKVYKEDNTYTVVVPPYKTIDLQLDLTQSNQNIELNYNTKNNVNISILERQYSYNDIAYMMSGQGTETPISDLDDISIDDSIATVKNFKNMATQSLYLFTSFFNGMPEPVPTIFITCMIVGVTVFFIKLIRG